MVEKTTTRPAPRYWTGTTPRSCDLCQQPLTTSFIDGATKPQGRWGCLCLKCHRIHGYGLGTGKGQMYRKQADERWLKVEG